MPWETVWHMRAGLAGAVKGREAVQVGLLGFISWFYLFIRCVVFGTLHNLSGLLFSVCRMELTA